MESKYCVPHSNTLNDLISTVPEKYILFHFLWDKYFSINLHRGTYHKFETSTLLSDYHNRLINFFFIILRHCIYKILYARFYSYVIITLTFASGWILYSFIIVDFSFLVGNVHKTMKPHSSGRDKSTSLSIFQSIDAFLMVPYFIGYFITVAYGIRFILSRIIRRSSAVFIIFDSGNFISTYDSLSFFKVDFCFDSDFGRTNYLVNILNEFILVLAIRCVL